MIYKRVKNILFVTIIIFSTVGQSKDLIGQLNWKDEHNIDSSYQSFKVYRSQPTHAQNPSESYELFRMWPNSDESPRPLKIIEVHTSSFHYLVYYKLKNISFFAYIPKPFLKGDFKKMDNAFLIEWPLGWTDPKMIKDSAKLLTLFTSLNGMWMVTPEIVYKDILPLPFETRNAFLIKMQPLHM